MENKSWLLLAICITACSPAAKLRKAERLIKKAEEAGAVWTVDSITVKVPVFITETRIDSIIRSMPRDTVVLQRERLKIVYVKLQGDSVWIEGKCDSLTIIKEVPVTITKTIKAPKGWLKWWHLLIAGCVGGFITLVAVAFRR